MTTTLTPTTEAAPIELPKIVLITPEIAQKWLDESNTDNRALRPKWVDALAREITEGRWMMTGDPIRFDVNGRLIDGQHRLHAIVRGGVPVMLFVLRDLPTEVRNVIDTGLSRTAQDVLAFNDVKVSGAAAAIRVAMSRRDGYYQTARDTRTIKYTSAAMLEFARENPDLLEIIPTAYSSGRILRVRSRAAWAYSMWALRQLNADAQLEFENSLVESRTNGEGDPRLALIRYFTRVEKLPESSSFYAAETIYITFAAWNAWRGERNDVIRFQLVTGATGPNGAYIPKPVV